MTTMTEPTTATLEAPGATLTYDVRRSDSTTEPALFLLGSPMGAGGFATLASHFPDRTIVTYDPRGVERSVKADPATVSTPDQHGDDIHRVIAAVGGPVDLFASSGGAVNALALVAKYPDDVRTLVAHEPPRDPAMFGLPAEDDGNRTDPLLFQNVTTCTHYQPDFEALRAAPTRIVMAAGKES